MILRCVVLFLICGATACAVSKADPTPATKTPIADEPPVPLPLLDGMKPVKYPEMATCLQKHMQPWAVGEIHRDFVISVKTTVLPLDLRVAPAQLLDVEPTKLCLLAVLGQIKPDTILFATAVRLYPTHAPSTVPLITGGLTPLQVREGLVKNEFGRCLTQTQYDGRLHGAALLKGDIIHGVLENPRLESSTFQDIDYETCVVSKMPELRFEDVAEPSMLAFPLSMRVSDLDPNE